MMDWLHTLYSDEGIKQLIASGGLLLLVAIVFAETGLFVGFFLPGDSLLMTAGVVAALNPDLLPYWPAVCVLIAAAIAGNCLNFWFGTFTGDRVRVRPDGWLFKRRYLSEAEEFYRRYGGWALVAGRFVPVVRTFVPFAAGMAGMRWGPLLLWSVLGGVGWVLSMSGLGYALAQNATMVKNLHLLVLAVVAVSFLPVAIGLFNRWRTARRNRPDGRAEN